MIRPSPNEFERLKNEEIAKRRLIRLKEVREYSKINASKLRNLYKQQKTKVINKIAQAIQEQLNNDDEKTIEDLKLKHARQVNALGDGHINAADWVDPSIEKDEQLIINQDYAMVRHHQALKDLHEAKKEMKSNETARLRAIQLALLIEKERAAEIAALPAPRPPLYLEQCQLKDQDNAMKVKVCDRSKFSVIESYETGHYNVHRMNSQDQIFSYDADNAAIAGQIRQRHIEQLSAGLQVQNEEQIIKAQLRGHQAIKKQIVHKDYKDLVTDLEHVAKGEMAKRQRDYHKNEMIGPNSAGYLGAGHNIAMMMYKEKCRERAVEAAVLESLKDITNCANGKIIESTNIESISNNANQMENTTVDSETKLSRLYEKIRKQKENLRFQTDLPTVNSVNDNNQNDISLVPSFNSDDDKSESITTVYSRNIKESGNVIQNALLATNRTDNILDKSDWQKEKHLQQDILDIDTRLANISDNGFDRQMPSSVNSQRTVQSNSHEKISNLEMSHELSSCIDSVSVETRESESVTRIREFQRNALMKLGGKLNFSQLYDLERELSNVSINSTTISDRSINKRLNGTEYSQLERNEQSSEYSQSSVSNWVNSQLLQTLDHLPNWVTSSDSQSTSDFNVSFKSSILSIKSGNSTLKTDICASTTTIDSCTSSRNFHVQPSLTEVSAMKKLSDNEQRGNVINSNEQLSQCNINSTINENVILTLSNSPACVNQINRNSNIHNINCDGLPDTNSNLRFTVPLNDETVDDLIDFYADDPMNTCQDPDPFILDTDLQTDHLVSQEIDDVELSEQPHLSTRFDNFTHSSLNHLKSAVENEEDFTMNHVSSDDFDYSNDNGKILINDFEQFLSNIIDNNVISNSKENGNQTILNECDKEVIPIVFQSTNNTNSDFGELNDTDNIMDNQVKSGSSIQPEFPAEITITNQNTMYDYENKNNPSCRRPVESSNISDDLFINPSTHINRITENNISNNSTEKSIIVNDIQSDSKQNQSKSHESCPVKSDSNNHRQIISAPSSITLQSSDSEISLGMDNKSIVLSTPSEPASSLESSLKILSEYYSTKYIGSTNVDNEMIPLSSFNSFSRSEIIDSSNEKNKIKNILSSTMKPEKVNNVPVSPDVSTIYSDASMHLKQRIMMNYFEANKERLKAALSNNTASNLTLKPLESTSEDDTPRAPDSGKASSRFTVEHSGDSTARMTNDDIFITPRNDSIWTDYTSQDEYSYPHSNLRPLSEYVSSQNNVDNGCREINSTCSLRMGLDETIKNPRDTEENDVDLINFSSNLDLNNFGINNPSSPSSDVRENKYPIVDLADENIPSSQKLSTSSNMLSSWDRINFDQSLLTDNSSTECNSSSFQLLESFHSSNDSNVGILTAKQIQEFETDFNCTPDNKDTNCSMDSKSDMNVSNQSLASFLNNEQHCQHLTSINSPLIFESTPKKQATPTTSLSIDNNEQMKIQLEIWKKQRLMNINRDPPKDDAKSTHVTKDSKMRQKDQGDMKSRTLKLWNKLEEVQKMNQIKQAEQLKIDNQLRKKHYAEKIRKTKMEKSKKNNK